MTKSPPLWPITLILVLICLPELVLLAADYGFVGSRRWRALAYTYGAFWTGLLGDWAPNYTVQPGTMFVSYSFLHAGIAHLLGNVAALVWLGPVALRYLRPAVFFEFYAIATLGGAFGFAALASSSSPMVGASGAIFGLAGGWIIWLWEDQPTVRAGLVFLVGMSALMVALNIAIWFLQDGQLAWETHLGGFIAGAVAAYALPRRATSGTTSD